jgi:tetratricopeptide (TPR) repeat protein
MKNLLLSLAVALAAFAIGWLAGSWSYGLAPALLVFPVVYLVLARRSGRRLQAVVERAMGQVQAGKVDAAKETLRGALGLAGEQFLVGQQVYALLGALEYAQRNFKAARPLLEKAWTRNWQAQAMLAVLDAKAGAVEAGLKRLDKAGWTGRKDPVFWAVGAWLLVDAGQREAALKRVAQGIEAADGAASLKELQGAIQNDRLKKFRWAQTFGNAWYQFFPEQAIAGPMPGGAPAMASPAGRKTWPQPRR